SSSTINSFPCDSTNHPLPPDATAVSLAAALSNSPSHGRVTVKVVPRPTSDCTSISPLCLSRMLRLIASPKPTPRPVSLVVRNGSNTPPRHSGANPHPSSRTVTWTDPPSRFSLVVTQRLPP